MDELLEEKGNLLEKALTYFDGLITQIEGRVAGDLIDLLATMDLVDGKIDKKSKRNKSILLKSNKRLVQILNASTFSSSVGKYLKNFDDVERIQLKILEKETALSLKDFDLSKEKAKAISEISKGLLNDKMIKANLVTPIKKILAEYITKGIRLDEAKARIREFIVKDENRRGFIGAYVNTLSREPLLRYDGMINQKAADEFDLDVFRVVGPLRITSMPVCREMVKGSGRFAKLYKNGKYKVSDIPKIIDLIKDDPGFVKGTTAKNYFINRNHWGCYHTFIPSRSIAVAA